MSFILPGTVTSTLEEGRQVYVAVPSRHGPHVTPELYAWSAGRLWFAAASTTVKTNVLRREPSAAAVVSVAGRSVVLAGAVDVFDVRDPVRFAGNAHRLPAAARALAGYAVRNAADLLAFARDAARGRLGWRLPARVLFALTPQRAAYVENDGLAGTWGPWSTHERGEDAPVPAGGEPAVAALPGPVAVPARWFADQRVLHVAPGLLGLLGLEGTFDISVVVDDYTAPGPAAKRGVLVRGRARLADDDPGFVEVEPEQATDWAGTETVHTAVD